MINDFWIKESNCVDDVKRRPTYKKLCIIWLKVIKELLNFNILLTSSTTTKSILMTLLLLSRDLAGLDLKVIWYIHLMKSNKKCSLMSLTWKNHRKNFIYSCRKFKRVFRRGVCPYKFIYKYIICSVTKLACASLFDDFKGNLFGIIH